nr:hypothetical protein [Nanoarchaeota archaeon]
MNRIQDYYGSGPLNLRYNTLEKIIYPEVKVAGTGKATFNGEVCKRNNPLSYLFRFHYKTEEGKTGKGEFPIHKWPSRSKLEKKVSRWANIMLAPKPDIPALYVQKPPKKKKRKKSY